MAPPGLLFGVKGGVTNWGLALVPTATRWLSVQPQPALQMMLSRRLKRRYVT